MVVETFESYRPYLFSIAYRMLGSAMDAEDMVQETYLRYQTTPAEPIRSLKAYLTTIIIRLCMDQLHLARRKREVYVGPWLPEPILTTTTPSSEDPAESVDREESISLAFLVLLEQLQPFERAVFLLREVFEYAFAEIASMLGKSEAACRRSFSRAKEHLKEHRPRFPASPETHRELLSGYFQAVENGEMTALQNLLAEEVARFSVGTKRFLPEDYRVEMAEVNRQPALIFRTGDQALLVLTIEVEERRIQAIRLIANPEKLARI